MTDVTSLLDAQATALLRRLSREQETRTRRLRDDTELQVRDLLRRSRSEARTRVHQAVLEQRRADDATLARRRAALDTRQRRARQSTLRALLDAAWRELPAALQARWEDPASRSAWCEAACAQAVQLLLDRDGMQVELDAREASALGATIVGMLEARGVARAVVVPVEGLGAGLRLRAGRAGLDATIPGLLAARDRVAAELLAVFDGLLGRADAEALP
jgi:hypothetical protein